MVSTDVAKGSIVGVAGGAATEATIGLERAAAAAGDVLNGIFGGLPWDMSPSAIVEAVGGGGGEAAAMVVPHAADVVVTLI